MTEYAARAGGADLIVLEIVPGESPRYPAGRLHILYRDWATMTTWWADFESMRRWLSQKLRVRTSWLAGTPVFTLAPREAS